MRTGGKLATRPGRFCRGYGEFRNFLELRNFLCLRSRHNQHVPADRCRLLLLRRTVAVLGILEAA